MSDLVPQNSTTWLVKWIPDIDDPSRSDYEVHRQVMRGHEGQWEVMVGDYLAVMYSGQNLKSK